jgi:hypothetical protein
VLFAFIFHPFCWAFVNFFHCVFVSKQLLLHSKKRFVPFRICEKTFLLFRMDRFFAFDVTSFFVNVQTCQQIPPREQKWCLVCKCEDMDMSYNVRKTCQQNLNVLAKVQTNVMSTDMSQTYSK